MRDIFEENLLDDEDITEFEIWAFGDNPGPVVINKLPGLWNMRHGHLLTLENSNDPLIDMQNMISLWRESKKSCK